MSGGSRRAACMLWLAFVVWPLAAAFGAEDRKRPEEDALVVKTVDGLRFKVPEDRPIERKDGIVVPMALDGYIAQKFSRMEGRLKLIEESIADIKKNLDGVKNDVKRLKEVEAKSAPSEGRKE